jgi:hypothetical protein
VTSAPGVELLPMWHDPLTVALPVTHPLAAQPAIKLAQLSGIPLRLAPRPDNPAFHDLILGACADAGFEPLPGSPFTTAQDALAEIGTGPPTWTVFYAAAADLMPVRRIAFRPPAGLTAQTCLAVPPGPQCARCSRRGLITQRYENRSTSASCRIFAFENQLLETGSVARPIPRPRPAQPGTLEPRDPPPHRRRRHLPRPRGP